MKKVVGLGIVAVAVAGAPYLTGTLAEKHFKAEMEHLQSSSTLQSVPFDLKIDVDYQRGWFTSTAVNTVIVKLADQEPFTFQVNNHISHGPILLKGPNTFGLAAIDSKVPFSAEQQANIAKIWKDNKNPVQIQSHIGFTGNSTIEASVAGFTLEEVEGKPSDSVTFQPAQMTLSLSNNMTQLAADFSWDGLQINSSDMNMFIGKVTGHSKKQLLLEDLWLGDDEIQLSAFTINSNKSTLSPLGQAPSNITFEGFTVTAHSEADSNKMIKADTTLAAQKVVAENKPVANDIKLTIALENLPAEAVQSITKKLTDFQKQAMQSGTDQPTSMPDFAALQDDLNKILAAGPVIKIPTLQANTEQGKIEANLEATIKAENAAMLQNPLLLMGAVQASANVSVPAKLIENTPLAAQVPIFVSQGYIINENDQLKSAIQFQQGQLTINGKPMQ
ncbi:YdgA family protein [Spartinivicinus poritis]|uniref:YdgA family protein n=1 Tax=Spartinivicinus poritis TaxID=2994640 RepID=A0ABT5UF78_9GAMM|nr:YdgA family protein [Spartinivicinus sp. A2-2]MDE1465048.1 YdgA family protein [Spartinivicinus sp. A2-2]